MVALSLSMTGCGVPVRHEDRAPAGRLVAGIAGFGDGRHIREQPQARWAPHRQRLELAALHVRHPPADRRHGPLRAAIHHRIDRRSAAVVMRHYRLRPAMAMNISPAKCPAVPAPAVDILILPGFALIIATRSCSVVTDNCALVAISVGW